MDNINFKKVLDDGELFDQQANYEENFEKINQFVVPKITDLETNKVDKETGKGLSTNDFDNTYKQKIDIDIPAQLAETAKETSSINVSVFDVVNNLEMNPTFKVYSNPVTAERNQPLTTAGFEFDVSAYIGQSITIDFDMLVGKHLVPFANFDRLNTFVWHSNGNLADYNPAGASISLLNTPDYTNFPNFSHRKISKAITFTVQYSKIFIIAGIYNTGMPTTCKISSDINLRINGNAVSPIARGVGKEYGKNPVFDWLGNTNYFQLTNQSEVLVQDSFLNSIVREVDLNKIKSAIENNENVKMVILGDSTEAGVGWRFDAVGHGYAEVGDIMKPAAWEKWYLDFIMKSKHFRKPTGDLIGNGLFEVDRIATSKTYKINVPSDRANFGIYFLKNNTVNSFTVTGTGINESISTRVEPVTYAGTTYTQENYALGCAKITVPSGVHEITITGAVDIVGFYLGEPLDFKNYAIRGTTLLNASSRNNAKGVTTDERFTKALAYNPLIYVLGWSSNDAYDGMTVATFESLYKSRIAQIRAHNSKAIIFLDGDYCEGYVNHTAIQDAMRGLAISENVNYIDVNTILKQYSSAEVISDYVHQSKKGYLVQSAFMDRYFKF